MGTPHWSDRPQTLHGSPLQHEQLPMFMTPREITSKYQVLDADREDHGGGDEWGTGSARNFQRTNRPARTGGETNMADPGKVHYGTGTGAFVRQPIDETDHQVFARKLNETQMDPDEYREHHQGIGASGSSSFDMESALERPSAPQQMRYTTSGDDSHFMRQDSYIGHRADAHADEQASRQSIHDSVRSEGVRSPVHLSTHQFGSQGKPQIVGGHHRIAAALDIAPDRLIPVQHAKNIWEAKSSGNYS